MSQYSRYPYKKASKNSLIYQFTSSGPSGDLSMVVQFQSKGEGRFNLAMGNLNDDGSIDDLVVTNNKDRNTILATVAAIVYDFCQDRPDCQIYFDGSTPERTRLYRMAITINYSYLSAIYEILGCFEDASDEPFQASRNYSGFWIRRK